MSSIVERPKPWRGDIHDEAADRDRARLSGQSRAHALSVPVMSSGGVWGELFVTRFRCEPFDDVDRDVAMIIAGLASTGLSRFSATTGSVSLPTPTR